MFEWTDYMFEWTDYMFEWTDYTGCPAGYGSIAIVLQII